MESGEGLRVTYDVVSKRVEVAVGDRRVWVPGKHDTLEEARAVAEAYAHRYLEKKK